MKKAVCIFSGGMDSITLLHDLKHQGYDVYGLSFDYGQKHKKELIFAREWGKRLCSQHKIVDLTTLKPLFNQSALINGTPIPHEHYTAESQKKTVVPNRNMVMLSIAAAWAENLCINEVYFGPHANDFTIYPDCRPAFLEAVSRASELGTYAQVKIFAPYIKLHKSDIVRCGKDLGIDYSQTWSCYEGGKKHCGKCGTCQERKEAFREAAVPDPTEYME